MSAILAVFNRGGIPVGQGVIEPMLAVSSARAVNGQSIWMNGPIALAHQHFWITPEELNEVQPLLDKTGRYAITCDGRIDNRGDLIAALELKGSQNLPISDTTLILKAFQRWGAQCPQYLLGEYAFVIWDDVDQGLFLARDELGMRGLCYYLDKDLCLVASEISQILAHPAVQPRLNESKIADYLTIQWVDHEQSFYEGIQYCPPAHCMLVSRHQRNMRRYWEIDPELRIRYKDDDEYGEHFLELLKGSVRCRLRTTGEVGLSLSGGLDSTTLAVLIASELPISGTSQTRLKSFSWVFEKLKSCDERRYIQPVIDQYDLNATFVVCDDRWTLRDLPNWPSLRDFIYHDAYAGLYYSSLDAAQEAGCQLLFTGMFGDELFIPSERYWIASMLLDHRFRHLSQSLVDNASTFNIWRELFGHGLLPLIPDRIRRGGNRLFNPGAQPWGHPGLTPEFVERAGLREKTFPIDMPRFTHPHQHILYTNLVSSLNAQGLSAMRHIHNVRGFERLDPFYDRRLITYILALPADQLGRPSRTRWVLRNAMDGLIPEPILKRVDKTSFYPLYKRGLLVEERDTVKKILEDPKIVSFNYVKEEWLKNALEKTYIYYAMDVPDTHYESELFKLWLCICLELWLRRYW